MSEVSGQPGESGELTMAGWKIDGNVVVTDIAVPGHGSVRARFTNGSHVYVGAYSDEVPVSYRPGSIAYKGEHWHMNAHFWRNADGSWTTVNPADAKDDTLYASSREKDRDIPVSWGKKLQETLRVTVEAWAAENPLALVTADYVVVQRRLSDTQEEIAKWQAQIENAQAGALVLATQAAELKTRIDELECIAELTSK